MSCLFKQKFIAFLASLWIKSLRVKISVPPDYRFGVLGLWHRDLIASCATFKNQNVHVFISESKDGEIFALAAKKLGYEITRGSDSRGALNVRRLLESLKKGRFVGMALDGPHGPALEVKPGSLWLAQKAQCPLWKIDVSYGLHFTLKTWDKFVVPLPLSKIVVEIKYFCKKN